MILHIAPIGEGLEWEILDGDKRPYRDTARLDRISDHQSAAYRALLVGLGFRLLCGIVPNTRASDQFEVHHVLQDLYKVSPNAVNENWGRRIIGPYILPIGLGVWANPVVTLSGSS